MAGQDRSPWTRRLRRLLVVVGATTSIYVLIGYLLDRMKAGRLQTLRERRQRELLRSHYTSLISTISFTLYALIPTLSPQIHDAYPIESISQALQGLSAPASSEGSVQPTPESSLVLPDQRPEEGSSSKATSEGSPTQSTTGVGESWSSEFRDRRESHSSEQPSLVGSSVLNDDTESSAMSQTISLPPTDTSTFSGSPPSDMSNSQIHSSPPAPPQNSTVALQVPHPTVSGKTKKELWRDLKVQTIRRAITTAYLVPLLYLLTASQLAIIARGRYLADVKDTLPSLEHDVAPSKKKSSWFGALTIDAMGLRDYVDVTVRPIIPTALNPGTYIPTAISSYFAPPSRAPVAVPEDPEAIRVREEQIQADESEDKRVYLTYSWWLLHEGWRGVAARVDQAVEQVFGSVPLKKELQVSDWEKMFKDVRARIETEDGVDGVKLYCFVPHILPPNPLRSMTTTDPCPLPPTTPTDRPHLTALLAETNTHLTSPDATYLIDKGVGAMVKRLLDVLREEAYNSSEIGLILSETAPEHPQMNQWQDMNKRVVDCLAPMDRWGKGVWNGMPDCGVENLTSVGEFENFVALVFGDWAGKAD